MDTALAVEPEEHQVPPFKLNKHDKPARRPDGKVKTRPLPVPFYRYRMQPTVTPMQRWERDVAAQMKRGIARRYVWSPSVRRFLASVLTGQTPV